MLRPGIEPVISFTGARDYALSAVATWTLWPLIWKQEFVTVIPKKTLLETINDLRNISCTKLPSKVYESCVLNWVQGEEDEVQPVWWSPRMQHGSPSSGCMG